MLLALGPALSGLTSRRVLSCLVLVVWPAQPAQGGKAVVVAAVAGTRAHVVRLGALGTASAAIAVVVLTLGYA